MHEAASLAKSYKDAPLRREACVRAMAHEQAEATEYARNNGFSSVRLLSVEEGTSYRGTE